MGRVRAGRMKKEEKKSRRGKVWLVSDQGRREENAGGRGQRRLV
jgi:hypothetical protein